MWHLYFVDSSEKAAVLLAKAAKQPTAAELEEAEAWRTGPNFHVNCGQLGLELIAKAGEGVRPGNDDKLRRRVEDALRKQGDPLLVRGLALALGLRLD